MSPIYYWGGKIETTSFDLVIFGTDGNVFKKVVGTDGLSTWANVAIEKETLTWSYCDQSPITGSECANINTIWLNTVPLKNEYANVSHIFHFFIGPEDDLYSWNCIHDVKGITPLGSRYWFRPQMQGQEQMCKTPLLTLYKGAVPMSNITISLMDCPKEIPIETPIETPAEIEKEYVWTCGNCQNNPPGKSQGKCTCGDWSLEEEEVEEVEEVETRIDPFNNGDYTKKEFLSHYGDYLQWNMMSPEKILKRQLIGTIIADNNELLTTKNVNHLLDKIIETFL